MHSLSHSPKEFGARSLARKSTCWRLLQSSSILALQTIMLAGPGWANTYSVGGGTISTTNSADTALDETGLGYGFNLTSSATSANDVIAINGVSINDRASGSSYPFPHTFDAISISGGGPSSAISVAMHGSTLSAVDDGFGLSVGSSGGNVSLNTVGGASNTSPSGYYVATSGSAILQIGADNVGFIEGEGSSVSIDTLGVTINAATGNGIVASGGIGNSSSGAVVLGSSNSGIEGTIMAPKGYGIYAENIGTGGISIALGANGTITAAGGIYAGSSTLQQVTVDDYGTITAGAYPAITSVLGNGATAPTKLDLTLESGSITNGVVQFETDGTNNITITTGANISNTTFAGVGYGSGTNVIDLVGTGTGALNVANISGINEIEKDDSGAWTLTNISSGGFAGALSVNSGTLSVIAPLSGNATVSNGATLQIGSGGTQGATSGNIANDGALIFDRSDAYTYAGSISGTGSLTQAGSGTLLLTGNNTYTGNTTVSSGALQIGDGGASGAVAGNIANSGTLIFDRSDTYTYAGVISGTGSLIQDGTGTLTLTGNNTYSGGTVVNSGTLSVSYDVNLGNGDTVALANGTTLNFGQEGEFTHAAATITGNVTFTGNGYWEGPITGTGGLTTTGTIQLLGSNSYLGPTVVAAGSLVIRSASALPSSTDVTVESGAELNFGAPPVVFSGQFNETIGSLSGSGDVYLGYGTLTTNGDNASTVFYGRIISGPTEPVALVKDGTGTLTLAGENSLNGETIVNAGTLNVTGLIGSVEVKSGATLSGTGAIAGSVVVDAGGTLAPGSNGTIGTLTVISSNLTLSSGSTYSMAATPNAADNVVVEGESTANLAGTLVITPTGNFSYNGVIPVVYASNVNGTFSAFDVSGSFGPGILASLVYNQYEVDVQLRPATISQLLPQGAPRDAIAVARAMDYAILHDNAYPSYALLDELSPGSLVNTLLQASGEEGVDASQNAFALNAPFLEAIADHLMTGSGAGAAFASAGNTTRVAFAGPADETPLEAPPNTWHVWSSVFGGWSDLSGENSGTDATQSSDGGLAFGVDDSIDPQSKIGAAIGFGHTSWSVNGSLGSGTANAVLLGVYGSHRFDAYYVLASADAAILDTATKSSVELQAPNSYNSLLTAPDAYSGQFDAKDEAIYLEAGRWYWLDEAIAVAPYASFRGQFYQSPAYTEKTVAGTSVYALSFAGQSQSDLTHDIGIQLVDRLQSDDTSPIDLNAQAGWVHQYAGAISQAVDFGAFAGTNFTTYGTRGPRNAARVALGAASELTDDLSLSVQVQALVSGTDQSYSGNATLSYRW